MAPFRSAQAVHERSRTPSGLLSPRPLRRQQHRSLPSLCFASRRLPVQGGGGGGAPRAAPAGGRLRLYIAAVPAAARPGRTKWRRPVRRARGRPSWPSCWSGTPTWPPSSRTSSAGTGGGRWLPPLPLLCSALLSLPVPSRRRAADGLSLRR